MNLKDHIFIFRSDNDLDHLVPILNLLLSNTNDNEINLFSRDPLRDFSNDFRIKYLKEKSNVLLTDLIIFNESWFKVLIIKSLRKIYWKLLLNKSVFLKKYINFISIVIHKLILRIKNNKEKKLCLKTLFAKNFKTITCDNNVDEFVKKCKLYSQLNGLELICFFHAIPHINSELFSSNLSLQKKQLKRTDLNLFDTILIPNKVLKDRYVKWGVDDDKILIIGSIRFFRSWVNSVTSLEMNSVPSQKKNTLKRKNILLIASKMQEHINSFEIFVLLRSIVNDDRFKLTIKPHTRNGRTGLPKDIERKSNVDFQSSTVSLIENADLILFWSTSVIYHAVGREKPILFLKYVYSLPFDFENIINSWNINNRNDFVEKINLFNSNNISWKKLYSNQKNEFKQIQKLLVDDNLDRSVNILNKLYDK